ncbi:uncharacterized protein LOC116187844 isoform X1 [Punica granatum]|nr:uncharacterized protein LOC116187844 isoform X1 [Punica granatum]XP_031372669.1 uncharacterized protein LOC116187844 isoform X1 [Punica granatum]XP_031372670.1 uncharacterized protein LOC116187844 isoform X1 [Punica granatum]XP_031372671.1 uncharacterized protein LOC116187844 isoform X1 [Punica granatum]XP_031372672.1 uncharacterized protein LOC116187844 isoform X1 [Punica granatum]XP_031372674.1 uncharacterized protein LOC116187844 isoform X1 [Punica granatum]XP_031372675.1 uncharacterize
MKGHEAKMARMEEILNLPVQEPPSAEFSAADIKWVKVEGGRLGGDNVALIPFSRVDDFVKGESANAECPANFRIESRRKRCEGSISKPRVDGYLEHTLYWCSYGPEDYRNIDSGIDEGMGIKPASGKGSRPGRRHMMRGCLCHFTVKRLYTRPSIALIIYNQRRHADKTGAPCHGVLDRQSLGTRAMYAPRISEELRQKVISMLYIGISLDNIMQHHMEVVQRHGGPQSRDDFLTRNDVRNMERVIRSSSYRLDENDECSVKMWVQRHQKNVFFFQDYGSPEPFALGIQTDWQLQQMLQYGHNGTIAAHSNFGMKKLKYPLCTLLAFDTSHNAIPVAWIITSSFVGPSIHKWIGSLAERVRSKEPRWRANSFLVDNPSYETAAIREAFQCRVLSCIWRVRRSWIRSLLKKCYNFDVQREMFKYLGTILYCTRNLSTAMDAIQEFMEVFVDQHMFMDYFKSRWLPHIGSWINGIRSLPAAGPEFQAAVESYHLRTKLKLLNERNLSLFLRTDWLVHTLTTEYHSLFWLDQYSSETGFLADLRDQNFSTNAWYHALNIPAIDVILDEQNLQPAKVLSRTDRTYACTIWNPGSEFSICDCS